MIEPEGTAATDAPPSHAIAGHSKGQLWRSTDVEAFRGFEYYRDGICTSFMDLIPEPDTSDEWSFFGSVRSLPIGVGRLNQVVATSHLVRRTKSEIARSPYECFYLNFKTRGSCEIHQSGQVAEIGPGDVGLFDSAVPFELEHRRCPDLAVSSFMLPRQVLQDRMKGDMPKTPVVLSNHPGIGALIRETGYTLAREADNLDAEAAAQMYDMLLDLVSIALSSTESLDSARSSSRASATFLAARNYVDQHHTDANLNAAKVAAALNISVRYLHKLFSGTDASFAEHLMHRRLQSAASALSARSNSPQTVATLSRRSGFGDPAHFHRAFKRHYGCTPREWRENG